MSPLVCYCLVLCHLMLKVLSDDPTLTPSAALSYLRKFGHAPAPDPQFGSILTQDALTKSIRSFQRFAGLQITGELDAATLQKMSAKRCGNPDIAGTDNAKRKKRYALQGSKWRNTHLTYKISSYTPDLSQTNTDTQIEQAFNLWAEQSGLTFSRVDRNSAADIDIKFASGAHGDGDPFDGRGQTLAHAYYPRYGGDAHFDEAERWIMDKSYNGANLRLVAAHEFGHSLGLSHSDVNQALMAPFYDPRATGLHRDDIQAIQHLYGKPRAKPGASATTRLTTTRRRRPSVTSTPPTTAATVTPAVGKCNGRFDAITQLSNGSTYAFVGTEFWRLNDKNADDGYPQAIVSVWGITGAVDAVLTLDKNTYIFQGSKVYHFKLRENRLSLVNYDSITNAYRGIPSDVDAVFQWSGNGKIYFTKGNQYWRYNPNIAKADYGYPRALSVWKGLPADSFDASMQWYEQTYFFSQGMYYKFDDEKLTVANSTQNPYPRRTDEWWLGCKDNTLRTLNEVQLGGYNSGTGSTSATVILFIISTTVMMFLHFTLL